MYELMVEDNFDAAHALRGYKGSCENMHGHTFRVQIFLSGEKLNQIGIMMDFREVKGILGNVIKRYDHTTLNDLEEYKTNNPSSENISKNIYDQLKKELPELNRVTVWESERTSASYERN